VTFDVDVGGLRYIATLGFYDDGRLGEIFLNGRKIGTDADTAARDSAVAASIALQCGVDAETLRRALCRDTRGAAMGPLGCVLDKLREE
jgi:hypothetical protein